MTRLLFLARRTMAAGAAALAVSSAAPAASATPRTTLPAPASTSAISRDRLADLPVRFEPNVGQTDARARYVYRGAGYSVFLTADGSVWSVAPTRERAGAVVRMHMIGSRPDAPFAGAGPLASRDTYVSGGAGAARARSVSAFSQVERRGVYPGVDVVYHGTEGRPEYDFAVAPKASPSAVALSFEGADCVRVDRDGALVVEVAGREIRQPAPVAYQETDGARRAVAVSYALRGDGSVGFSIGAYDGSRPLVIDPVVSFASFLGGDHFDQAQSIAVDASGAIYVAGLAGSSAFPSTTGAYQTEFQGSGAAFVTKIDPATKQIVYSTFIAGTTLDAASSVAVDANGSAYVAGTAYSTDFPTTAGSYQPTHAAGADAFVAKLSPSGDALVYSTFLGASSDEYGNAVAVTPTGEAVVVGNTTSTDFPTTAGAVQTAHAGGYFDAFVARLDASGASLVSSTFVGGTGSDLGNGVALDRAGNAYVAGTTNSTDFPTTAGAPQATNGGDFDAYVAKVDPSAAHLVYATYVGGSSADGLLYVSIAVDRNGGAYVTGDTDSQDFPTTTNAVQRSFGGGFEDAFVAKVSPAGTAFDYVTYLGGSADDHGVSVAVDAAGRAAVVGYTTSSNFPLASPLLDKRGGGTVFETANAGASWTHASTGTPPAAVTALAFDHAAPSKVYAGTASSGVYASVDGGASWHPASSGIAFGQILGLAVTPSSTVYVAAASDDFSSGGVFESSDGGATWTQAGAATLSDAVIAIAVSPSSTSTLYASTFPNDAHPATVYKSVDGGATWAATKLTGVRATALAVDPSNPSIVYAGTFGQNVSKTTDGGKTWKEYDGGLRFEAIGQIGFDPTNPARLFLGAYATDRGADGGVFTSVDGGKTWTLVSPPFIATAAFAIDPTDDAKIYAASPFGVFQTADGGRNWTASTLLGAKWDPLESTCRHASLSIL